MSDSLLRIAPTPGTSERPSTVTPNVDACFKVLVSIQDQVRLADAKTGFLFGINALMFGFAASAIGPLKAFWWAHPLHPIAIFASFSLVLFVVLDAAAVFTLIWMVVSRFRGLSSSSHVFFGHIVKTFGDDSQRYADEVVRMNPEDWSREICAQIVSVSHIAMIKHGLARRAAWLTIAAFSSWLMALLGTTLLPVQLVMVS